MMKRSMESPTSTAAVPAPRAANSVRAVVVIMIIAGVLRLALAACVGLSVDESYTVAISRQLALSYFDHPPLHVWLVGEWAKLIGREDPWLVRLPFIVVFAGTTWLMYRVTSAAFGERAGFWAVLALNLAPLFTVGTASWVLPDGPLVFFSLLAVWLFTRALQTTRSRRAQLTWWLAAGAAAGLALLAKYLAIFPILGLGIFLLTSPHRRVLATPAPWLALILVAALFTPVIVWNVAHSWVSLSFQGSRALPHEINVGRFGLDLAGQFAYLLPWTAAALVYALVRALWRGPRSGAPWLFACLSIGPIIFFVLAGLWTTILPHWPAVGWLFTFPLLGYEFARIERSGAPWLRGFAPATAGALLLLLTLTVTQAMTGWMYRVVPGVPADDPTTDVLDWSKLRATIESQHLLAPGIFVATVSWVDAGKVDYALGGEVPVLCLSHDPRQFAFLTDQRSFRGRDAIIVANARRTDWQLLAAPYFQHVEFLGDVQLTRSGQPALTLKIARGVGFKSQPTG
jgi:4-amino-4-deoxy-L-arabinose transferase-like glycosyltransferase